MGYISKMKQAYEMEVEYLRQHNAKATAMGINFSQVLQEALMNKLNIER